MLARVADSCFWLSRYIERAETNARILDVNMQLMLDFEDQNPNMLPSTGSRCSLLSRIRSSSANTTRRSRRIR